MNDWCISCSCTFSTGCKKEARDEKGKSPEARQANVAKVAKWYAENKERRHAYLRERYKRMKGGEVRRYEKEARDAAPKRNHYSTPEQRREQYKRYTARHPRNEYFKRRYAANKLRQSSQ